MNKLMYLSLYFLLFLNCNSKKYDSEKYQNRTYVEKVSNPQNDIKDSVIFYDKKIDISYIKTRLESVTAILSKSKIASSNKAVPYTFVHQFYIPLLYAYETDNKDLIICFNKLSTLNNLEKVVQSKDLTDLDKKIFIFYTCEYLRLNGLKKAEDKKIFELVRKEMLAYWLSRPGKNWSTEHNNFTGKKARIASIIANKYNGEKSYYNAVTDNELFVLASGLSLSLLEKEEINQVSVEMQDISDHFYYVMQKLVKFNKDGTWLLQPNVWRDHADYQGVSNKENVSWDTSHFSRFPAFLNLMGKLYINQQQQVYIDKLKQGLAKQFVNDVVSYNKAKNIYTFSNYINGTDDNYRVGYKSVPSGYQASSNNTHFFYGWWKLLNSAEIDSIYKNVNENFAIYESNPQLKKLSGFYKNITDLK